jgi:TonB family protein
MPTYDASKIAQLDAAQIDGAIEHLSAGASLQLSMPELIIPVREAPEPVAESLPIPEPDAAEVVASLLEPSSLSPGLPQGKEHPVGLGQLPLGDKQSPSRWKWPQMEPPEMAPPPEAKPVQPEALPQTFAGIQGPAAKREPLSQPSLPEVVVEAESEITLKFWVRPDGIVSRVLTLRRGDAALEAAATRYIEGWRFNPLPPHEAQQEQWGTITVRFLLPTR